MKQVFEGYTLKDNTPVWTFWNWLNFGALIQKTKPEALIRYTDGHYSDMNKITKVRITFEEIQDKR